MTRSGHDVEFRRMQPSPGNGLEEYAQTLDLTAEEVVTLLDEALADDAELRNSVAIS